MAQQQTGPFTSKQYFKSLMVLGYALTGAVILFSLIVTVLVMQGVAGQDKHLPTMVFTGAALVFSFGGVAGSLVLYNKMLAAAKAKDNLKDMLSVYRAAAIARLAPLEGAALFSIIVFFLTGQYYMLALVSILVAIMLNFIPYKQKVIDALEPSSQQIAILNDDNAAIE